MGPSILQNYTPYIPISWLIVAQFSYNINPTEYKFLSISKSCLDPSVGTQIIPMCLRIYEASHPTCACYCRGYNIICLIIGNPSAPQYLERDTGYIPHRSNIHLINKHHRSALHYYNRGAPDLWSCPYNIWAQHSGRI